MRIYQDVHALVKGVHGAKPKGAQSSQQRVEKGRTTVAVLVTLVRLPLGFAKTKA